MLVAQVATLVADAGAGPCFPIEMPPSHMRHRPPAPLLHAGPKPPCARSAASSGKRAPIQEGKGAAGEEEPHLGDDGARGLEVAGDLLDAGVRDPPMGLLRVGCDHALEQRARALHVADLCRRADLHGTHPHGKGRSCPCRTGPCRT